MKLFEMKHIKKSFDGLEVLKDISLDVEEWKTTRGFSRAAAVTMSCGKSLPGS